MSADQTTTNMKLLTIGEQAQITSLHAYEILNAEQEEAYDDIVRLAALVCETPIAAISLIDHERLWLKSHLGLSASEASRDVAFCTHTIRGTDLMVVPDARVDHRFAGNPLVLSDPNIRLYVGAPLVDRYANRGQREINEVGEQQKRNTAAGID